MSCPNDRTGYQDSLIWNKLFNFQRDAATGIINKLETYNGCILADSVGLGKTFTALAVIKYYELRNRSCPGALPEKAGGQLAKLQPQPQNQHFRQGPLQLRCALPYRSCNAPVANHSALPLNRVNWGNYDLVVIDESHNFRNNDVFKDRETRYQKTDECSHQGGREDQSADAFSHAGQQPL